MRINARLDEDQARKVDYLRERTGQSVTDVIRAAIERYHAQISAQRERPAAVLARTGFVGCGEADANLSRDYKRLLAESLDVKHGHR
ncbi:ribbon-helix-helix protein, CopG family [uncultured Thiodictyon sp.]|jgi:Arc/MetJ-type ribon-helix-helix transcriptional regulator|uniref:ribbon-helix-helix protein, CopG family n=1 Tax=uncultured Thiodictyon sp. TaxID=1846217 RepID=UPI0025DD3FBC|nr:ribbon-helix-helix protein, CopG family [uncultured Thiodictyon sp.]